MTEPWPSSLHTRHLKEDNPAKQLVLLDALSMGLAPIIVDEIFEFLVRLAGEAVSPLVVEQYVAKSLCVADKVYLLTRSRIANAGDPDEVREADLFSRHLGADVLA